jgi:membrane protein YqaA with SNARE-associated domain
VTHIESVIFASWFWNFTRRFGAFMFFPLGLLDMSVIPAPGSFDFLLIVLTASHRDLWWYYALMATAGSVVGAWPTFELARKGGEEAIEKRLGSNKAKKVFGAFRRWGFWSIFLGAVMPPPMPATATILAAGALRYPWRKFLLSWMLGRLARFSLVAFITMHYGSHLFNWLRTYYRPALWILIGLATVGGAVGLWFYLRKRHQQRAAGDAPRPDRRAA